MNETRAKRTRPSARIGLAGLASLSLLVTSLLLTAPARGQSDEHVVKVEVRLSQDAARPGDVVRAAVVLKIRPGYHINDNAPLDEFLFATSLSVDDTPSARVLETYYPAGHRGRFAYSESELVVYEGETVLGVLIKIKDEVAPGRLALKAGLGYQACDSMSCLPPTELPFEISIPVVAAGAETHEQNVEIFRRIPFKSLSK